MSRQKIAIDLKAVEDAAADGLTEAEVAARLNISEDTISRRKKDSADFAEAIKRGKARANAEVSSQLFKKVRRGDLGAIIWYEKTRKGYSDKVLQEVSGKDGKAIEIRATDYRSAIAALAPTKTRPVGDSNASGESENRLHGAAVGQDDDEWRNSTGSSLEG
jgi:transposase